jgi:hypothetical protein
MLDTLRRARWVKRGALSWSLMAAGGACLATVMRDAPDSWHWEIGHIGGFSATRYGAQRAARSALQEAL